jgi:hypothetical protein
MVQLRLVALGEFMAEQDVVEQRKTELCRHSEMIGEGALTGEIFAIVSIAVRADGSTTCMVTNMRGTEALGLLGLHSELLKRKLLA